jgi:hypothetical protein
MQDQIDRLTNLVTELAHTVKQREHTPTAETGAQSSEAET